MADKTYMDGSTNRELDEAILGEDQYSTYYFSNDDTVYDVSKQAEVDFAKDGEPRIQFRPETIEDLYTFTLELKDTENFPDDCKVLVWRFSKGTDPAAQDTVGGEVVGELTKDNATFKYEQKVGRYYGAAEAFNERNQSVIDYVIKTETLTVKRETKESDEIDEVWSSEKGFLREVKGNFRQAPYFTLEGSHGKMTSSTEVDPSLNFQLVNGDWGETSDKLKPEYGRSKWAFENNTGEEIHIIVYAIEDADWNPWATDWKWTHVHHWKLLAAVDKSNNDDDKGQDHGFWFRKGIAFGFDLDKMADTDIRQIPKDKIPFIFRKNCERIEGDEYKAEAGREFF